jgi:uncharacterized membrane protein (UPF0127 family)
MAAATSAACSAKPLPPSPAGLAQEHLTIHSTGGNHRFVVEVAKTFEEQQRGLMFRRSLAPDRGMIFTYDPPQNHA